MLIPKLQEWLNVGTSMNIIQHIHRPKRKYDFKY